MTSPETASRLTALRVIDANLNRIGEGLRLLEDIARLMLNDSRLTQQLKNMRHDILEHDLSFNRQLLQSRDSEGDVGIDIKALGQEKQKDLPLVAVANSRRVQESLRAIEELAKIPGINLDSNKFKQARFDLYTIEQTLVSRLLRRDKAKRIYGLCVILDNQVLKESPIELVTQAIAGGARAVRLHDKVTAKKELLPLATALQNLCSERDVLFIIDEHLDLALAVNADGLHVEPDGLPIEVTRRLLPIDKILGCSVTTVKQALAAQSEGADYVAIGPIYPTGGKKTARVAGLKTLSQIRKAITLPIVAMGDINKDNTKEVMAAGADSVAIVVAGLEEEIQKEAQQIAVQFEEQ